jgi:basic membrane protein A and related proteins
VRQAFRVAAALAAVALLAAGCAKPSSSSSTGSGSGTTAAKFSGCMVTDTGGINDKSFNQSSWAGMQAAAATNPNITVKYLPSTTTSDYAKNISTFISQKCGIIVTVGFLMGASTEAAAKANPKQKFAIVDCSYSSQCLTGPHEPNITQLVFNTAQDAFLGGYLAAGMTKTGKVATYGGMKFGTVTIYMDGFWDGVQYYNKQHHTNVQVLGWSEPSQNGTFAGSFTNITAGQTIANTFITAGADIIFPVAGGVGLGSAKAVQTANAAGKNVSMFWVDTDGCVSAATYCKYFVTSVEKGISTAVKAAVLLGSKGHAGGSYVGTLANGGAVLAPYHFWASKVPAKLQTELAAVKAAIISGQIVPATKSPV